ncbi:MAG: ABC transporter permease [Candidatus Micrarchaeota archaeon]|nr:ABC transporter permease [Candidatus Micrarchaeota archaeon]
MNIQDLASIALDTLRHRSLRSWLAILGIIIGVAAVVTLIAISFGVSDSINSRLNTLGTNIITISPGGQSSQRSGILGGGGFEFSGPPPSGFQNREESVITFSEADSLRNIPGVNSLDAQVSGRGQIEYGSKTSSSTIVGTEPREFPKNVGVNLTEGRFLESSDIYTAIIGASVANRTFGDTDPMNKQIKINNMSFRVVGVLNASGVSSFGGSDSSIYIPQKTAKTLLNQTKNVNKIVVMVADGYNTQDVANSIKSELETLHSIADPTKDDFTVTTALSMQSTIAAMTNILTLFLGGIASVALIVGGIGTANTMFMSVLEQTRQIGVYKSLGMTGKDVMTLFILEACIIGTVGGVLGVLLSIAISSIITSFGLPVDITPALAIFGIAFSAVVGIISGLIPARNASSIPPVEALRYE